MNNHWLLSLSRLVIVTVGVACVAACESDQEAASPNHGSVHLRQQLELLLEGNVRSMDLYVEYDDMHSFHGGETLTVSGDTMRSRHLFRGGVSPRQVEPPPVIMTVQQVRDLVHLLLEIEAWAQRVPEREAVLDESVATLTVRVGTVESSIWEWYNDLNGNNRIVRAKRLLEEIAGPIPD
jgi:hypothetical protein